MHWENWKCLEKDIGNHVYRCGSRIFRCGGGDSGKMVFSVFMKV